MSFGPQCNTYDSVLVCFCMSMMAVRYSCEMLMLQSGQLQCETRLVSHVVNARQQNTVSSVNCVTLAHCEL